MRPRDLRAGAGRLFIGGAARLRAGVMTRVAGGIAPVAERVWRLPLMLASALFVMSGIAQSFGRSDTVFVTTLVCVLLGAIAVPLGLVAMLAPTDGTAPSREQAASHEPGEDPQ